MASARTKLNRAAARRERNRLERYAQRMADLLRFPSDRMKAKRETQETYLDQVTLDHERGLELGRIARAAYREACAAAAKARALQKAQPPRRRRKTQPRPAETYRWARKKLARGAYRSLALKADRIARGMTRKQMDLWRHKGAREALASA